MEAIPFRCSVIHFRILGSCLGSDSTHDVHHESLPVFKEPAFLHGGRKAAAGYSFKSFYSVL